MSIEQLKKQADELQVQLNAANDQYGAALTRLPEARNELDVVKNQIRLSHPNYSLQAKKRDLENEIRVLDTIKIPEALQRRNELMDALHLAKRAYNIERLAPVVAAFRERILEYNALQAKTAEALTKLHETYYTLPACCRGPGGPLHLPRLLSLPSRLVSCPVDEGSEPEVLFDFREWACKLMGVDYSQYNVGDLLLFEPKQ